MKNEEHKMIKMVRFGRITEGKKRLLRVPGRAFSAPRSRRSMTAPAITQTENQEGVASQPEHRLED